MNRYGLSQVPGMLVLIVVGVMFLVAAMGFVVFAQGEGKGLLQQVGEFNEIVTELNPVPGQVEGEGSGNGGNGFGFSGSFGCENS